MSRHRTQRQRGQITVFLAMAAIPIALGIAYLFNSADLLSRKVRVQDAADAAALAQGTWMARSLNVMATNNVALTQTAVINDLAAAIQLTVVDLVQFLTRELTRWSAVAVATCPLGGFLNPKCDEALAKLVIIYDAGKKLEDLVALNLLAHKEFYEHARAYAAANNRIAKSFPAFSARMQQTLAATNGLQTPPRLQAVGWRKAPGLFASLDRTGLPVSPMDAASVVKGDNATDAFSVVWTAVMSLNRTGWDGPRTFPFPMARNFKDHGYESGKGPYPLARDSVKKQLEAAIDRANLLGWSATIGEDEPKYDRCWDTASTPPLLPWTCKQVALGPPVTLYGPSQAPALDGDVAAWGVTDILVLARSPQTNGRTASSRFPNAIGAAYGIAKVRVYSATSPDLYSSDWRAALVPVTSWRGNSQLPPQLRPALENLARSDPTLSGILRRLSNQELLRALSR